MSETLSLPASRPGGMSAWMRHRTVRVAAIVVSLSVLSGTAVAVYRSLTRDDSAGIEFCRVSRAPMTIDVSLPGALENRDQVVVRCGVEGRTVALWLAPEGNYVREGDLLAELDSSMLRQQQKQQEITVIYRQASFVQARELLDISKSQGLSGIKKAELDLALAELDLRKYQEGDYKRQVQQARADSSLAEQRLKRASEQVAWSRRLQEAGFLTSVELQSDEFVATKAGVDLELARTKLRLLEEYTNLRDLEQLKTDVKQAERALDRAQRQAAADLILAKAELVARESERDRQAERLTKIGEQIAKCSIHAPVSGLLLYASSGKMSHPGHGDPPLAEGAEVHERQELFYLPTTAAMTTTVSVPEPSMSKIHMGMAARIVVDAGRGKALRGHVSKIGLLPDAQSRWMNPDLRVYAVKVELDEESPSLRAGMGCRVQLIVEEHGPVLQVPLQSVVRVGNGYRAYVLTSRGPQERAVEIGMDNGEMIHIRAGLREGERVMKAPPLSASAMDDSPQARPEPPPPPPQGGSEARANAASH